MVLAALTQTAQYSVVSTSDRASSVPRPLPSNYVKAEPALGPLGPPVKSVKTESPAPDPRQIRQSGETARQNHRPLRTPTTTVSASTALLYCRRTPYCTVARGSPGRRLYVSKLVSDESVCGQKKNALLHPLSTCRWRAKITKLQQLRMALPPPPQKKQSEVHFTIPQPNGRMQRVRMTHLIAFFFS